MLSAVAILSSSYLAAAPISFTQWINSYDLPEDQRGQNDNPAGDGISNLAKYALGLDPDVASRDGVPTAEMQEGKLTLTVSKNPDAMGIEYIVEGSSDLEEWSTDGLTITSETDTTLVVSDDSAEGRRFLRLRIPAPEESSDPDAFLYVVGGRTISVANAKNWDLELDRADQTTSYSDDPAFGSLDARSILIADVYFDTLEVTNWRRAQSYLPDVHPENPLGILHWTYIQNAVHFHNGRIYVGPGGFNGTANPQPDGSERVTSNFITWAEVDQETGELGEFMSSPSLSTTVDIVATAIVEVNGDHFYYVIGGNESVRVNTIHYGKIDPVTGAIDSWSTTDMGLNGPDYFAAAAGHFGNIYYTTGFDGPGWELQWITPRQEDQDDWLFKGDIDWSLSEYWQTMRYADALEMPGVRWDHTTVVGEVGDETYLYVVGGARTNENPTPRVDGITLNPDGTIGDIVEVNPLPAARRRLATAAYKDIIIQAGGASVSSVTTGTDTVFIGRIQPGGNIEWQQTSEPMWQYRSYHGATLVPASK